MSIVHQKREERSRLTSFEMRTRRNEHRFARQKWYRSVLFNGVNQEERICIVFVVEELKEWIGRG